MVALGVSERLSPEALRSASRSERGAKVRARMLAIARLLEGGERRPANSACPNRSDVTLVLQILACSLG